MMMMVMIVVVVVDVVSGIALAISSPSLVKVPNSLPQVGRGT